MTSKRSRRRKSAASSHELRAFRAEAVVPRGFGTARDHAGEITVIVIDERGAPKYRQADEAREDADDVGVATAWSVLPGDPAPDEPVLCKLRVRIDKPSIEFGVLLHSVEDRQPLLRIMRAGRVAFADTRQAAVSAQYGGAYQRLWVVTVAADASPVRRALFLAHGLRV